MRREDRAAGARRRRDAARRLRAVRRDGIDLHDYTLWDVPHSRLGAVPEYRAALADAGLSEVELWSAEHATYLGEPAVNQGQCEPPCQPQEACTLPRVCVPKCQTIPTCPDPTWQCDTATGLCAPDMPEQSEREQARSLVYRFTINRAAGVRRIMWATLPSWGCFKDDCGGLFDRVGLVSGGFLPEETPADVGRPRLAYHSFRLLAERTDETVADRIGEVATSDAGAHVFAYRHRASGDTGLVAWADEPRQATLAFAGASAHLMGLVTDAAGAPLRDEALAVSAGEVKPHLDPDPVWIARSAAW